MRSRSLSLPTTNQSDTTPNADPDAAVADQYQQETFQQGVGMADPTQNLQVDKPADASQAAGSTVPSPRRGSIGLVRRWMEQWPNEHGNSLPNFNEVLDELSTLERALRHVQRVFEEKSLSIRETFQRLDSKSYGYISMAEFRQALDDTEWLRFELSSEEKDMVCQMADPDKTGRLEYRHFFDLIFGDIYQTKLNLVKNSTLTQVVVVFRHGARFPLKPFSFDSTWPKDDVFWKTYGGKLTPTGQHQLYNLGELLRKKYLTEDHLLGEDDPNLPKEVYVYTSNSDRTLTSAQSLLLGMFPNVSQSFAIERNHWSQEIAPRLDNKLTRNSVSGFPANSSTNEQADSGLDNEVSDLELEMNVADNTPIPTNSTRRFDDSSTDSQQPTHQTIKIHLADMSVKYLPLLHGYKNNPRLATLKAEAFRNSTKFRESARDEACLALLQKLWDMTGYKMISPRVRLIKRLQALQTLAQQIAIERAHKMRLFSNIKHIWLEEQDERKIRELADYTVRLRYQGLNDNMQREMSRLAAGTLPFTIYRSFKDVIDNDSPRRLALFSGHDNTIMALLSHMGFKDWEVPQFGAHLIFELHKEKTEDGVRWYVKFAYNSTVEQQLHTKYVVMPSNDDVIMFQDAKEGVMDFDDFENMLLNVRRSIRSGDEWVHEVKPDVIDEKHL